MWKLAKILIPFLFIYCSRIPSGKFDLAFISYITRLTTIASVLTDSNTNQTPVTPPVANSNPKLVSLDFVAEESLAPVVISKTQTLGATFDMEMDPAGCAIQINGDTIQGTTTASTDKLTLFFKPDTSWGIGQTSQDLELSTNCKSALGISYVSNTIYKIYILDSLVYVDSIAGNDNNPGTMQNPIQSLSVGINAAATACSGTLICGVLLKGGIYSIAASITIPINISIYGGFSPSDWRIRRSDKTTLAPFDTIINDASTSAIGSISNPYGTIKISNNTGTNILDGIIINGPTIATVGSYIAPIAVVNLQSGSVTHIRNTTMKDVNTSASIISSGFMSYNNAGSISINNSQVFASTVVTAPCERHGIYYISSVIGSLLSINTTDINAGYSTVNASGILTTASTSGTITVANNTITGATCAGCDSIGVTAYFATVSGMSISNNTITSGNGSNSYGINFINGTGLVVSDNSISSGNAAMLSAAINSIGSSSTATVTNNVLTTGTCSTANCKLAGIINSSSFPTLTVSGNTFNVGSCAISGCATYGLSLGNSASATTVGISNNNFSLGSANTGGSYGIILTSTSANQAHTISGNTFTGGTATAGQVSSIYRGNASAGATVVISNNTAITGDCTGSCINRVFDIQNVGGTTTISGNTISAGAGVAQSAGIELNNSAFTLTNNIVTSGDCTQANCFTNAIKSGFANSITLTGNTFTAGSCSGVTCSQTGVNLNIGSGPLITVTNNIIDSGTPSANTSSRTAFSLLKWANTSSIQRNTFINRTGSGIPSAVKIATHTASLSFCSNVLVGGGTSSPGNATTLEIELLTGGAKFIGNTIIGPSVSSGSAFPVNFTTTGNHTNLSFDQNIIASSPASSSVTSCIRESVAGVQYNTLVLNTFSACGITFYNRNGALYNTLCTGNFSVGGCGTPLNNPTGLFNITLNPVFINSAGNNFHLDAATPAGILNGLVENAAPSDHITKFATACGNVLDRDGNTRVSGSAIGAYK